MCHLRDCSVCECPQNEVPEPFKKQSSNSLSSDDLLCQDGNPQAVVDRTIDTKAFRGWAEVDNPWTYDNETDDGRPQHSLCTFLVINLVLPLLCPVCLVFYPD